MLRSRPTTKDFTALPLTECLAKTYRDPHGATAAGRTVLDHALITGAVAALLLEQLPKCTLPFYPEGTDRIVSAHDVGKVCPTFQHKIHLSLKLWAGIMACPLKKITLLRAPTTAARHGKSGVKNCSPSLRGNGAGLRYRQRHRHCS